MSPLCVCICVCVCVHACASTLSRLSHVQLFVILWTVTHQGPLSTGFSRQEYWSGLPFPFSLSNRKRALLNPGAVLWEIPLVLQRPQGQGSPGHHCSPWNLCIQSVWLCARHLGSEATPASSPAAGNPSPGGVEGRHTAPPQRGATGCAEAGGRKDPCLGKAWPL